MTDRYIVPDRCFCYDNTKPEERRESMTATKAQQRAVNKYMKENYDEIKVRTDKGKKEKIKAHAEKQGESVNAFINRAIDEQMQRDKE